MKQAVMDALSTNRVTAGRPSVSRLALPGLIREAHAARSAAVHRALVAVAKMPSVLLKRLHLWRQQRREVRELAALDERALRDIGLSRYDVLMPGKDSRN